MLLHDGLQQIHRNIGLVGGLEGGNSYNTLHLGTLLTSMVENLHALSPETGDIISP